MLSIRNRIVRVDCILLVMAVLATACDRNPQANADAEAPPPTVTVTQPVVQKVTDWDEFTGRLYAVESVEVRPRVSGYLQSIGFKEGTIVKKGDLLYVIDPRPYQAVLDQALAEVNRAKAALELAEADLVRANRLFGSRAISQEELDNRANKQRVALAAVEAARAAVKSAELNVEFTHIRAPITGRISRTRVTEGNLVSGGEFDSTPLTTIVSLDPIYVYFTGDERDVLHYTRLDMAGSRKSSRNEPNPVLLRLADEEEYLHKGHMDFVDNQIDLATATIRVRAVVANPDYLLMPGMFVDVRLLGEGPYETLLVPDAAINVDQTIRFVYVVGDHNIVERRPIQPGRLHGELRAVRGGLRPDDRVIINGIQRVRAGMQVTPESVPIKNAPASQG
jgi:RND family efflux transporter MFP subunit